MLLTLNHHHGLESLPDRSGQVVGVDVLRIYREGADDFNGPHGKFRGWHRCKVQEAGHQHVVTHFQVLRDEVPLMQAVGRCVRSFSHLIQHIADFQGQLLSCRHFGRCARVGACGVGVRRRSA